MLANIARALGTTEDYLLTGRYTPSVASPATPSASTLNPSHAGQRTVKDIIESARLEIANATGVPFADVKLKLQID
jgi:hypothetical protein